MEDKPLVSSQLDRPTVNCLFCDRELREAMKGSLEHYQPYFGGEVQFIFAYGSTKFDDAWGCTKFRGFVCDDCGEKYVSKMTPCQSTRGV